MTVRGKQIYEKREYDMRGWGLFITLRKALTTEVKVRSVGELCERKVEESPRMTVFSIVFAGRDLLL
jgi:hypothetical protein